MALPLEVSCRHSHCLELGRAAPETPEHRPAQTRAASMSCGRAACCWSRPAFALAARAASGASRRKRAGKQSRRFLEGRKLFPGREHLTAGCPQLAFEGSGLGSEWRVGTADPRAYSTTLDGAAEKEGSAAAAVVNGAAMKANGSDVPELHKSSMELPLHGGQSWHKAEDIRVSAVKLNACHNPGSKFDSRLPAQKIPGHADSTRSSTVEVDVEHETGRASYEDTLELPYDAHAWYSDSPDIRGYSHDLSDKEEQLLDTDEQEKDDNEEGDEDNWHRQGKGISSSGRGHEENTLRAVSEAVPMAQRIIALRNRYVTEQQAGQLPLVGLQDITGLYDFSLDKFQRLSIEVILRGSSVVVSAPTGSGKTLIAEAAAAAALTKGRRLIYTTPLKALSNQKLREFRLKLGEDNVGLLTGDAAVNREAPVLVMTTEILRNMLYDNAGEVGPGSNLAGVEAVVLDEVHYLSDTSRGTVYEETVICCPPDVQLICLSATVANAGELAAWIRQVHGPTELVTSSLRPVPLTWHLSLRSGLLPLLNKQQDGINKRLLPRPKTAQLGQEYETEQSTSDLQVRSRRSGNRTRRAGRKGQRSQEGDSEDLESPEQLRDIRRRQVPRIRDTLLQLRERDMLPAIWFIFSRRGCDSAISILPGVQLLEVDEEEEMAASCAAFVEQYPDAVRESAMEPLHRGIAAHHAGCLPAWKSFVEELFQQGLIKVVFATETLAAGINMPARTTVLSTLSKRGDQGHTLLSANALLQMAGRAGRRGQDVRGHVVIVQSPFEGAAEACQLLFAGPDPLVSQFSATYGMALNLLGGTAATGYKGSRESLGDKAESTAGASSSSDNTKFDEAAARRGRSMQEARALIERSFGNYVGNVVVVQARRQLEELDVEVGRLKATRQAEAAEGFESHVNPIIWRSYQDIKEKMKEEKRTFRALRDRVAAMRVAQVQPLLKEIARTAAPLLCLQFRNQEGKELALPALYVDCITQPFFVDNSEEDEDHAEDDERTKDDQEDTEDLAPPPNTQVSGNSISNLATGGANELPLLYYVALGADNRWYVFTARAVKGIYLAPPGIHNPGVASEVASTPIRQRLLVGSREWTNTATGMSRGGAAGAVWCAEGSSDTWPWSSQLPLLEELTNALMEDSLELRQFESQLAEQRAVVLGIRKALRRSTGYKAHCQLADKQRREDAKLERLVRKAERLRSRLATLQPTGWPEFVQVVNVLRRMRAVDLKSHELLPLGETAAALRGVNELWLAMAFRVPGLAEMQPPQLAAVCAALVAEGLKFRSNEGIGAWYEASEVVQRHVEELQEQRAELLEMQTLEGVQIECILDAQFSGMIEAWAAGVSWKELVQDCGMDEGDIARLLRRTIDLLAQVEHSPTMEAAMRKNARQATYVMDRPPISELFG